MRVARLVVVLVLALLPVLALPAHAQEPPTWVRTFPKTGPQGCNNWAAEWSDGTFTATVWDCGDRVISNQGLVWVRSFEQVAENGCIEYVTEYTQGYYTWIPFSCPEGVIYYKPDWYLVPPWNGEPRGVVIPGNVGAVWPGPRVSTGGVQSVVPEPPQSEPSVAVLPQVEPTPGPRPVSPASLLPPVDTAPPARSNEQVTRVVVEQLEADLYEDTLSGLIFEADYCPATGGYEEALYVVYPLEREAYLVFPARYSRDRNTICPLKRTFRWNAYLVREERNVYRDRNTGRFVYTRLCLELGREDAYVGEDEVIFASGQRCDRARNPL